MPVPPPPVTDRDPSAVPEPGGDPRVGDPTNGATGSPDGAGAAPLRLRRETVVLEDGHRVGVARGGTGVPLVLAHGYLADSLLYGATLRHLAALGFHVVAIDTAGHGGTAILTDGGRDLLTYARLLGRTLDHLGVDRAVLVGHSMGGRLVSELAADQPGRALGLVLVDAAVGAAWDRLVAASRVFPPMVAGWGALLLADLLVTFPVLRDQRHASELARGLFPTMFHNARRPWQLWGPLISLLRSGPSCAALDRIGAAAIPAAVVHGDLDLGVPLASARDAAARVGGELVVVHRARHSWLLKDPRAFPAILAELLAGDFGARLAARGGAPAASRTPPGGTRPPRYRWTVTTATPSGAAGSTP
jgi:pimeloyl-ACP methyl ester carboxylesterase